MKRFFRTQLPIPRNIFFLILFVTASKALFLTQVPLFGDEALYCYLGYLFGTKPFGSVFTLATSHWKDAPGLLFLNAINFIIFGQSKPIEICRLTSVISSFVTALAFFFLVRLITTSKRIQIASLLFLLLNPFSFFFDRTNLMDVPLVSFILFFLYFSLNYLKSAKPFFLCGALFSFTAMFFTKVNSLLILPIIPLFSFFDPKIYKKRVEYYLFLGSTILLCLFISIRYTRIWDTVFYHVGAPPLLLGIGIRFVKNMRIILSWYRQFLTPLFFPFMALGMWQMFRKKHYVLLITFPFLISFYALVSVNLFPRYLLFTLPFIALMFGFATLSRTGIVLFGILLLLFLKNDYSIIIEPSRAILAREVYYEYFEDWGSGVGTTKAVQFLGSSSISHTILVPTDLIGLFYILSLEYAPLLVDQLVFFKDEDQLEELLSARSEKVLVVSTPYHEWITRTVQKYPQYKLIYVSNEQQRNSIFLYEF